MKSWIAEAASRDDWLALTIEEPIAPDMEIVDPHHHLWNRDGTAYEVNGLWSDTGAGHKVVQTVFIECGSFYYKDVEEGFAPVGETAYVAGQAALAARSPEKAQIAGIVAHADLRRENLSEVLDAHAAVGGALFKGIRHALAWDDDPSAFKIQSRGVGGLAHDPDFRRGLRLLGERGLTYDTWHYHHQNKDFIALAKAVPETTLVLDHFGTPLGVGQFEGKRDEIFAAWKDDVAALADCPNVVAKLGGMAMPDNGYGWHEWDRPIGSEEFVEAQAPWYHHMIACFGADRCMFESNFPVDRASISYGVLWNGLKKIAADYPPQDQMMMFSGTSRRVYGLPS
ncbi:amidohydrolase family protein [Amylibacter sp. IMCC11727]|uniref:amidohydrolase family protein n=1 Tax=Amylibacter sp. IMCC11727 TaxID=3039851 RepID=UPI00244DA014|nr:amidohydrolase family protein [Amylibacter sp. IMCC11727]WGI23210.1 amidohydrolase family protein [Amylibacter sp. IMCC11727]